MAPPPGRVPLALLLVLLLQLSAMASSSSPSPAMVSSYVPEKNRVLYRTLLSFSSSSSSSSPAEKEKKVMPAATVPFQPFEMCSGCRCCPQQQPAAGGGGNSSSSSGTGCIDMKCCYGIKCNLPGKPFGTCAFTPRTCGCTTNDDCPANHPPPSPPAA